MPEDFQADGHFLLQNIFHSPTPKDMTLQLAVKERTDCIVSDSANVHSGGCPFLSFRLLQIPASIKFLRASGFRVICLNKCPTLTSILF